MSESEFDEKLYKWDSGYISLPHIRMKVREAGTLIHRDPPTHKIFRNNFQKQGMLSESFISPLEYIGRLILFEPS